MPLDVKTVMNRAWKLLLPLPLRGIFVLVAALAATILSSPSLFPLNRHLGKGHRSRGTPFVRFVRTVEKLRTSGAPHRERASNSVIGPTQKINRYDRLTCIIEITEASRGTYRRETEKKEWRTIRARS